MPFLRWHVGSLCTFELEARVHPYGTHVFAVHPGHFHFFVRFQSFSNDEIDERTTDSPTTSNIFNLSPSIYFLRKNTTEGIIIVSNTSKQDTKSNSDFPTRDVSWKKIFRQSKKKNLSINFKAQESFGKIDWSPWLILPTPTNNKYSLTSQWCINPPQFAPLSPPSSLFYQLPSPWSKLTGDWPIQCLATTELPLR